jgi:hypothetical protein
LRKSYEAALAADKRSLAKNSPLAPNAGVVELPRFFAQRYAPPAKDAIGEQARGSVSGLNPTGFWPAALAQNSHPYRGPASKAEAKGDFASTHVGDETDTSPFNDTSKTPSISTQEYLRNMNILIRWLASGGAQN